MFIGSRLCCSQEIFIKMSVQNNSLLTYIWKLRVPLFFSLDIEVWHFVLFLYTELNLHSHSALLWGMVNILDITLEILLQLDRLAIYAKLPRMVHFQSILSSQITSRSSAIWRAPSILSFVSASRRCQEIYAKKTIHLSAFKYQIPSAFVWMQAARYGNTTKSVLVIYSHTKYWRHLASEYFFIIIIFTSQTCVSSDFTVCWKHLFHIIATNRKIFSNCWKETQFSTIFQGCNNLLFIMFVTILDFY